MATPHKGDRERTTVTWQPTMPMSRPVRGNLAGIMAMLIACALFTFGDSIFKLLGRTLPLGEMLFVRGLLALPMILILAVRRIPAPDLISGAIDHRVLLRSGLEAFCTVLFFVALIRMSYADAIAIQQFTPLATTAAAAVFLAEPVGWRRWLAALVGFTGVLIVIRPGSGALNWPALVMLGCVASIVARDLVTRNIAAQVPTMSVTLMAVIVVNLSGLAMWPFEHWVPLSLGELVLLALAAASSTAGFYWVVEALRRGDVSVVVPFRYSLIPYGVLSGILVFGEWPDLTTFLGISIVLGAGLYAFHRERVRAAERPAAD